MKKNNILKFNECYGCGICIIACPINIISLKENEFGFYQPEIIHETKCLSCGKCLNVCSYNLEKCYKNKELYFFASWSKNPSIRYESSSGGLSYEIGKQLLNEGYLGIGVKYNSTENRAEHYKIQNLKDLRFSVGSKYIPSNLSKCLKNIDFNEKHFFIGTPCQVDSFKKYLKSIGKEHNFILIDFFCHGLPSLLLWDKYLFENIKNLHNITHVSWRNKKYGWHDSWNIVIRETITGNKKERIYFSSYSQGDIFYKFFLGNICLNKPCYEKCKYKLSNSVADIRLGDLWGSTYKTNEKGISGLVVYTQKGRDLLNRIDSCYFIEHPPQIILEGQMKMPPSLPWVRKFILRDLKTKKQLKNIYGFWMSLFTLSQLPIKVLSKIIFLIRYKMN